MSPYKKRSKVAFDDAGHCAEQYTVGKDAHCKHAHSPYRSSLSLTPRLTSHHACGYRVAYSLSKAATNILQICGRVLARLSSFCMEDITLSHRHGEVGLRLADLAPFAQLLDDRSLMGKAIR